MSEEPDVWLTMNEAAAEAHVGRRTIYNWMYKNKLVIQRTAGGPIRILRSSLFRPAEAPTAPQEKP